MMATRRMCVFFQLLSAKRVWVALSQARESCFRDSLVPRGLVMQTAYNSLNRSVAVSRWLLAMQVYRKAALRVEKDKI